MLGFLGLGKYFPSNEVNSNKTFVLSTTPDSPRLEIFPIPSPDLNSSKIPFPTENRQIFYSPPNYTWMQNPPPQIESIHNTLSPVYYGGGPVSTFDSLRILENRRKAIFPIDNSDCPVFPTDDDFQWVSKGLSKVVRQYYHDLIREKKTPLNIQNNDFEFLEKIYSMLTREINRKIRLNDILDNVLTILYLKSQYERTVTDILFEDRITLTDYQSFNFSGENLDRRFFDLYQQILNQKIKKFQMIPSLLIENINNDNYTFDFQSDSLDDIREKLNSIYNMLHISSKINLELNELQNHLQIININPEDERVRLFKQELERNLNHLLSTGIISANEIGPLREHYYREYNLK